MPQFVSYNIVHIFKKKCIKIKLWTQRVRVQINYSEEIREKTICEDPDIILVGNKCDMEDKRQVPRQAAISLAQAHK
jgi:hypothetical protein